MSFTYDMFTLLEAIKKIIYKFEYQRYLPLYLHNAKTNFYNFRQGTMTNIDYLDKFTNLTDLDEDEQSTINAAAREIYLSCALIVESDPKCYGLLVEELYNDYTKGNNNYPTNMVKAY